MRINGSGQSHDAGPLYRNGRPMHWTREVVEYLLINVFTIMFVYPSLLIWGVVKIWRALAE